MYAPHSPNATRYEPPVHKLQWVSDTTLSGSDCLELLRNHVGVNLEQWQRILWHGGVHINKRRVLDASFMPVVPAGSNASVYWFEREPEAIALYDAHILYNEHGLIAVNKPAWIPVQGTRASTRFSLEWLLRERFDCLDLQAVHRLDRGTSGINMFALSGPSAGFLGKQFEARTVRKSYLAVVHPIPLQTKFSVSGCIVQVNHPQHAYFELRDSGGRESLTHLEVLEVLGERALVRAMPVTGRTHQIRVHLAASGTPIVGDNLYGPGWELGAPWTAERLHLHAASLEFCGVSRERVLVEAPLPEDWEFSAPKNK